MSLDEGMLKYYYLNTKVLLILKLYFRISSTSTQIGIKCSLFKTSGDIFFLWGYVNVKHFSCEGTSLLYLHFFFSHTCVTVNLCVDFSVCVRLQLWGDKHIAYVRCCAPHCETISRSFTLGSHPHLHGYDCHIIKSLSALSMIHPLSNQ